MEAKVTNTRSRRLNTKHRELLNLCRELRELGALQVTVDGIAVVFGPLAPKLSSGGAISSIGTLPMNAPRHLSNLNCGQRDDPDAEDLLGFDPSVLSGRAV